MFALAWQYLSGRAVAKDIADGMEREWPPHPDRIFQALVAAWGEASEDRAEREALVWLEAQPPPHVAAPQECDEHGKDRGEALKGASVKVYVPPNDETHKTRKERYFPSTLVGDGVCALIWPSADPGGHAAALEALASRVTYVGHSRSLVGMRVTEAPPTATWKPADHDGHGDVAMRVPHRGRIGVLSDAFAGGGEAWRRPPRAPEIGYQHARPLSVPQGDFEPRLLVLHARSGDRFGLSQTMALTGALRGTLNKHAGPGARPLITGHAEDGTPLPQVHLAYLPLAFVGADHADGHLLGLGLALPKGLSAEDEERVVQAIGRGCDENGRLRLVCGKAGVMEVGSEARLNPPRALQDRTWCKQSKTWASVTPIVLDRMPPRRHEDQDGWAVDCIAEACERQGLPMPIEVETGPVSALKGVPPAKAFVPLVRKDEQRRWHLHAWVRFAAPIKGPLLLGAGRFRGYGMFKPFEGGQQ